MLNIYFILFLIIFGCKKNEGKPNSFSDFAYKLDKPDEIYSIPTPLKEISGIQYKDEMTSACIEDNHGIVYIYSFKKNEIIQKISFAPDGDYEDLSIVKEDYYILRSDGTIFQISSKNKIKQFETNLSTENNPEGLCFDSKNNRLLIACKDNGGSHLSKHKKAIYSFSLTENKISKSPVIIIDLKKQERISKIKNLMDFSPSGIAINPINDNLFIISARGNILIETDPMGNILYVKELPEKLFPQPEGICFSPSGELMISNEGKGAYGSILRFKIN